MFEVFNADNVKVKTFKRFDSATRWVRRTKERPNYSIAEMGVDYSADRIIKLWKWNSYQNRFQRAHPETGDWLAPPIKAPQGHPLS